MKLLDTLRSLASTVFDRARVEGEMEEELCAHIQHRADDLARSGLPRSEAERRARLEFGGYQRFKEECREAVGAHFIETFVQDVRFGLRLLKKSPGFTSVAVLTLALGIGANTAIFSLIDTVMLRFLPVDKPEELVLLERFDPSRGGEPVSSFTNPLWEQVRDRQDIFSSAYAWSTSQFDLAQGGTVHYVNGLFSSGAYFTTLGVRPAAGRLFTPADDQRGCPAVAVLAYGFWQEHFGGSKSAIGSVLSLNRHLFQVIGVSAPGFYGMEVGSKFDVAIPICTAPLFDGKTSRLDQHSWWWLSAAGRLKRGVSPEQLEARLGVLAPQVLAGALPPDWDRASQKRFLNWHLTSAPAATGTSYARRQFGQPLILLMAVVGLVLLIASANLASLMFARAASRNREIAVRKALGASPSRLIRQLLTECLMLSFAGALVGILFARWGAALLVRFIWTAQDKVFLDLSLDVRVLSFTAAIAVVTGILVGILPALRSTGVSLTAAMKGGRAEETTHRVGIRPGKWMVASQVALSLVLLVVAGLFLRSFAKLTTLDLGFDRTNVLIVKAGLKTANIQPPQRSAVYDEIESRLRALPGVVSVGRSVRTPVSNFEWNQNVQVDSANPPQGDDALVYFNFVSPGYFQTLRTPVLAGRDFNYGDTRISTSVAIVNETFSRKFFPHLNPVGRSLRTVELTKASSAIQIVGVVRDSKYESIREDTYAQAFFPASQTPGEDEGENFEVRTGLRPSALVPLVGNVFAGVNKGISLDFHSLAEQVDDSMVKERLLATLSTFFGALALLLAMIGLYGALSYLVAQRGGEFGLRIALGAPPASILRLVMRDVSVILFGGAAAGIVVSLLTVQLVQRLLFGLGAHDARTMLGATVVLASVALIAGYLPARRAMRVDPMVALRYE